MAVLVAKAQHDLSKLEPLDGTNYKQWSQKLLIFFEQLDVDYVLFTIPPEAEVPAETSFVAITPVMSEKKPEEDAKVKCDRDNKTVRGHLLNHMNNTLFDLFVNQKSAKKIWNTLKIRYGGDDADRKKYVVGKWLQFHMVDEKPLMDQVHEYENLVTNVLSEANLVESSTSNKVRTQSVLMLPKEGSMKMSHKPTSQPKPQINLAEQEEVIAAVVVEANLVENKQIGYWTRVPQDTSAPTKNYSKSFKKHMTMNVFLWAIPPPPEFWVKGRFFLNSLSAKF
ncbi:UNVERIFIED_CONTAM: hypothetical protein Slati_0954700 [Sesamum latifolium]|uniref:Ty1-copia retrotransposon protein n=1 Tax=Sesamum latifolium TaxID=2727402 RepID=A0AAW2XRL0_9LAMI